MSQRPSDHSNFSLILILGVSLMVFGLPFLALAQQASGPWSQLIDEAQDKGQARVIIRLRENTPLSKNLSTPQSRINRQQAIRSLQDDFVQNMGKAGMQAENLKRFKYFPFIAMHADRKTLQALQNSPRVAGIEEDTIEPPTLATSVPLIGADNAHTQGFDGTGWAVAILDTGVDKTHSFFGGRVVSEACFSTTSAFSNSTSVCPGGVEESTAPGSGVNCDATDPGLSGASCNHGTHVAGIASGSGTSFTGVAPGSDIIAIQVFSRFDDASDCSPRSAPCVLSFRSDQILGLEHVLSLSGALDIASANMSLGGGGFSSPCDASESARKTAIDNLRAANVATVIASGNGGSNSTISTPACISTAVSVGSTTKSDSISSFSNRADFLSLMAPGSSIRSSVPGGGFSFFNGTSMATPHVAGTWAVLKQAMAQQGQQGTVSEILAALQTTGTSILDNSTGLTYPRINVDDALQALNNARAHNDFNGASQSDILFMHSSGVIANGVLLNSALQTFNQVVQIDPALGWKLNSTGDFNGDRKADLLLYDSSGGGFRTVTLDGATILNDTVPFGLDPTTGLVPHGTGDFNGDGRDEIVVYEPATGLVIFIFLDAAGAFSSFEFVTQVDTATNWTLHRMGDYNGDGKTDLLLYNTANGSTQYLEMDGSTVDNSVGLLALDPAAGWMLEETGDLDGNGSTDLVFLQNGSLIAVITLANGAVSGFFSPGSVPANNEIVNVGKYSSDNKDDFLFRNTLTGEVQTALQNGATITSTDSVLTLAPATGWSVNSGKP